MRFKYFDVIIGLFISVLLISNVASAKIVKLGPLALDGGTILFPLAYIFGDIFTEVYGYKKTRRIIWIGFFVNILMAAAFIGVGKLPSALGWDNQGAYNAILGWVPRIVIASVLAYWFGEFSNSFILAKMKILTKGKWLWTRTIGSTFVGEFFDTIIFCLIAFWGNVSGPLLLSIILSNYVFKVGVEIIFTPITYKIVKFLKRNEQVDTFDYGTKFNPLNFQDSEY